MNHKLREYKKKAREEQEAQEGVKFFLYMIIAMIVAGVLSLLGC